MCTRPPPRRSPRGRSSASPSCLPSSSRSTTARAIEQSINNCPPPQRLEARQEEAVPLLTALEAFLHSALGQISGKSTLAQAIRYALTRWPALTRYTTDGRLEMTNNAAERAIRPLVMTDSFCTSSSSVCKH
ncbi:MAG: transposase [Xanthobacteraceae bacterium]